MAQAEEGFWLSLWPLFNRVCGLHLHAANLPVEEGWALLSAPGGDTPLALQGTQHPVRQPERVGLGSLSAKVVPTSWPTPRVETSSVPDKAMASVQGWQKARKLAEATPLTFNIMAFS